MPSKKRPTPKQFRALLEKHHIVLKGSALPREWPPQHRQHFEVIRAIWGNRYDDFKANTTVPRAYITEYKKRVNKLRQKALDLHEDTKINETTWRMEIENLVVEAFNSNVICPQCENEQYNMPLYQAMPLDRQLKDALEHKRAGRRICQCVVLSSKAAVKTRNDDDEHGFIFRHKSDPVVSHDPDDTFDDNISIPMKPDRVIGLARMPQFDASTSPESIDIEQDPIEGSALIYPFLVMEAKKDREGPGFRAIQTQTAFPVRRFLKVQQNLREACGLNCEPFLVWFLAYQGEDWRLYAATYENSYFNVYELWYGTIESQDCALQLLQIMDYIWTWARDIYRPQIRRCLRARLPTNSHSTAPAPNRFYSPSVINEDTISMIDCTIDMEVQHFPAGSSDAPVASSPDREDGPSVVSLSLNDSYPQDANMHPFLRWSAGNEFAPSWTKTASIRHSDIVSFSFMTFEIIELQDDGQDNEIYPILFELWQQAMAFQPGQLSTLSKFWADTDHFSMSFSNSTHATVLYRTFCQPLDWQIKRELTCIIWPPTALTFFYRAATYPMVAQFRPSNVETITLIRALEKLQSWRGNFSVGSALQDTLLVLLASERHEGNHLEWKPPTVINIPADSMRSFMSIMRVKSQNGNLRGITISPHFGNSKLRSLRADCLDQEIPLELSPIFKNNSIGGLIAVRPQNWPSECPRFCLFVLKEVDPQDKKGLGDLLRLTLDQNNIVQSKVAANGMRAFDDEERSILDHWCRELRS